MRMLWSPAPAPAAAPPLPAEAVPSAPPAAAPPPSRLARALTTDFCPWANRYVYWLKHPLAVLAFAAAGSLLLGVYVAPQGYVACAVIVGVMVLGVVWPGLALKGASARLRFERRRGREGRETRAVVTIVNRWPWPLWGLALEGGLGETDRHGRTALTLAHAPGWSETDFPWDFTPPRRGEYPNAAPRLTTAFPFGLWKGVRPVETAARLRVWPQTWPPAEPPALDAPGRSAEAAATRRAGDEGEVLGARPFRVGDPLKRVHWALTARHGTLIVRERQADTHPSAVVRLDADPAAHWGAGPQSSFEWAVRTAASLAESLLTHRCGVEVRAGGESLTAAPGQAGIAAVLDFFAVVQPAAESGASAGHAAAGRSSDGRPSGRRAREVRPEFVVTTERGVAARRSEGTPLRTLIVLAEATGEEGAASGGKSFPGEVWIELDGDPAAGLRRAWERWCDATCAV